MTLSNIRYNNTIVYLVTYKGQGWVVFLTVLAFRENIRHVEVIYIVCIELVLTIFFDFYLFVYVISVQEKSYNSEKYMFYTKHCTNIMKILNLFLSLCKLNIDINIVMILFVCLYVYESQK